MNVINHDDLERLFDAALREIEPPESIFYDLREGLRDTPKRMAKFWAEQFFGYQQNPEAILKAQFSEETDDCDIFGGMVIVKDIPFYSMCEHHLVPFFGTVSVGYIPDQCVVGLSKIARLVDCFAKRLQIQERMSAQIASSLFDILKCKGVIVIIEAEHLCMAMRGVKKPGTTTVTSSLLGVFETNPMARNEFLQLIKG